MGAPTPLVLLPLWCSYPLGCSYPLVLLRWVLLPLGCSYPIGCSYPLRFVFVLVDVSLLMGGLTARRGAVAETQPRVRGTCVCYIIDARRTEPRCVSHPPINTLDHHP